MADGIQMNEYLERQVEALIDMVEEAEEYGDGPFLTLLTSDAPEITRGMAWIEDLEEYEAAFKGFERKPIVADDFTAIDDDGTGPFTTLPHQTWSYDQEAEGDEDNEVLYVALVGDLGDGLIPLYVFPLAAPKTFAEDGDLITVAIKHRSQNPPWPEPAEEEP